MARLQQWLRFLEPHARAQTQIWQMIGWRGELIAGNARADMPVGCTGVKLYPITAHATLWGGNNNSSCVTGRFTYFHWIFMWRGGVEIVRLWSSVGHGAHIPLIKILLALYGERAQVRLIINMHYSSRSSCASTHVHKHEKGRSDGWLPCENEINTSSLSFVMKCISCSFIWLSANSSKSSNSAKKKKKGCMQFRCAKYSDGTLNCWTKVRTGVPDTCRKF